MGKLARFTIFFLGCALLAAILSPWIYLGVKELSRNFEWSFIQMLATHPFHRYFNRVFQISIIVGVLILWRKGSLSSLGISSWKSIGFDSKHPMRLILIGFISSLIFFSIYQGVFLVMGWQEMKTAIPSEKYMEWGMKALKTAIIVSLLEEIFFRGYFYQICKQSVGRYMALLIQLVFFSAIHYVKPLRPNALGEIGWSSGFQMLGMAFQRFGHIEEIFGGLLVLMVVAWILCRTFEMTGSLYLPIGLHAGWVFIIQTGSEIFQHTALFPQWVLGGGRQEEGVAAIIPLVLQFLVLKWWMGRGRKGA